MKSEECLRRRQVLTTCRYKTGILSLAEGFGENVFFNYHSALMAAPLLVRVSQFSCKMLIFS